MRAQPVWKDSVADHGSEIEQLHLRLAAVNASISGFDPMRSDDEALAGLKASALSLTRQIDEIRCSIADAQLTGLLAR